MEVPLVGIHLLLVAVAGVIAREPGGDYLKHGERVDVETVDDRGEACTKFDDVTFGA